MFPVGGIGGSGKTPILHPMPDLTLSFEGRLKIAA